MPDHVDQSMAPAKVDIVPRYMTPTLGGGNRLFTRSGQGVRCRLSRRDLSARSIARVEPRLFRLLSPLLSGQPGVSQVVEEVTQNFDVFDLPNGGSYSEFVLLEEVT